MGRLAGNSGVFGRAEDQMARRGDREDQHHCQRDGADDDSPAPGGPGDFDADGGGTGFGTGFGRGSGCSGSGGWAERRGVLRVQIVEHLASGLVTLGGIPLQALQNDGGKVIGHLREDGPGVLRLGSDALVHELHSGFAAEGDIRGEHFVDDEAHGINVGAMIHVAGLHLFGRHVARSAEDLARARHHGGFRFERFCQSEIGDVNIIGLVDQDVLRFEIAVNHAFAVGGFEGGAQLAGELKRAVKGQAAALFNNAGKIRAFDQGHGDVLDAAGIPEIVNPEDILV